MHPNIPSVIARQRYRELLAEADAHRPGRLIRAGSRGELVYPEPLGRRVRLRLPQPNLGWPRMLQRLARLAER